MTGKILRVGKMIVDGRKSAQDAGVRLRRPCMSRADSCAYDCFPAGAPPYTYYQVGYNSKRLCDNVSTGREQQ